jgi:hypothetical protein
MYHVKRVATAPANLTILVSLYGKYSSINDANIVDHRQAVK